VFIVWGDLAVACTVAVALFAASAFATVIATALPALIHRCGKDPAYGAGPALHRHPGPAVTRGVFPRCEPVRLL